MQCKVTINTNRFTQRHIEYELSRAHSEIKFVSIVRKSADVLQTTQLVVDSATLLISIILMIKEIRTKQPPEEHGRIDIEVEVGGRKLTIQADAEKADISQVVRDFLDIAE